jgi:exosortase
MRNSERSIGFALLCILASAVLWRPLAQTINLAIHNDECTYILLILPISVTLIWSDWAFKACTPSPNMRAGLSLFAASFLIAVSSSLISVIEPDLRLAMNMLALVLSWIAAFVLCFGIQSALSFLFPLCFLFWMIPIPFAAQVRVVQFLQRGSAVSASLFFSITGVPVSRDGILLYIPGLNVEVARECSSIRSSMMLLVTTMVIAQVLLRTPWRKLLVIVLAVPLSIAKNGLRIFTIGMLGTRIDRSFLSGRLHRQGGIVFFLIALAMITVVLWILRRNERTMVVAAQMPRQGFAAKTF